MTSALLIGGTGFLHVLETCNIRALGWQSTPVDIAMARTVDERIDHIRAQSDAARDRDAEERLLADIAE